jgi:hypothetical protein
MSWISLRVRQKDGGRAKSGASKEKLAEIFVGG